MVASAPTRAARHSAKAAQVNKAFCPKRPTLCTETTDPWNYQGQYTGHDEPSLLFYSNTAGSGNSSLYQLTLPKDPPTAPNQAGTGGTWNFQFHPPFCSALPLSPPHPPPNPARTPAPPPLPCP